MGIFRLPRIDESVAVLGQTGSGKSVMAWWLLSVAPFDQIPYFIIDYKGDETLNSVPLIKEVGFNERPTKKPGLYIIHSHPEMKDQMERWLRRVWENTNNGLLFDEMYMVPDSDPLTTILTQGRSLRIPCICLSQRPAWISKFVFSESKHICVFTLQDKDDRDRVARFAPRGMVERRPRKHWSWWYVNDVDDAPEADYTSDQSFSRMQPVPPPDEISERIEKRLLLMQQKTRMD